MSETNSPSNSDSDSPNDEMDPIRPESDSMSPTLPAYGNGELDGLDPRDLIEGGLQSRTRPTAWEPPTPEELSKLLPQYEIDALLGRGGMGAVYRGRQATLDRKVAIKLLPAEMAGDAEFVARFKREARTLAKLHHPGIVLVHDFGQTDEGHLYFVMEFVDGTDLYKIIHGPGLDCAQALEIVGQICDALQYAHSEGVVHRDIKPANVIVALDGRAKLADFGLARPTDDGSGVFTQTSMVMGTPDYMAPEALAGEADHRADLYSLGVMLYEMLTGKPPRGAWDPPSQRVKVDVRLDEVVVRALQENPDLRYQQASDIKTDVEGIRSTPMQKGGRRRRKVPTAPQAKSEASGGSRARMGIAAVAVVVAVGFGLFLPWALKDREPTSGEPGTASGSTGVFVSDVQPEPQVVAARERGGKLRVFGHRSNRPIELGAASDFDDFVEVSIGNEGWLARRANGETYGQADLRSTEPKEIGPLFTTHLLRGLKDPWMRMTNGSFGILYSSTSSGFKRIHDPAWSDPAHYLNAYGTSLVLASDGSIDAWAGGWDVPDRARPPEDFFLGASAWASGDTYVVADRRQGVRSFRADGTLTEFPAEFRDVVEMDAGRDHVTMRSRLGEVFVSDGVGQPYAFGSKPLDLGPAVAIRAGCRMSAAQMEDGSWRAWGESTDLVNQVEKIGHTIDLDLHSDPAGKLAYMMWIEPVEEGATEDRQTTEVHWQPIQWNKGDFSGTLLQGGDGWIHSIRPDNQRISTRFESPEGYLRDFGLRLRYRWSGDNDLLKVGLRNAGGIGPYLHITPNEIFLADDDDDPGNGIVASHQLSRRLSPGSEGTIEFALFNNRILARFNEVTVLDITLSEIKRSGSPAIETTGSVAFRDLEIASLKDLPDPLAALGWDLPESEPTLASTWQPIIWHPRDYAENLVEGDDGWVKSTHPGDDTRSLRAGAPQAYALRFPFRWGTGEDVLTLGIKKADEIGHTLILRPSEIALVEASEEGERIVATQPLSQALVPGTEGTIEIAFLDDRRIIARLNERTLIDTPITKVIAKGNLKVEQIGEISFRDVETLNLDGIDDQLAALGWTTPETAEIEPAWQPVPVPEGKNVSADRWWARESADPPRFYDSSRRQIEFQNGGVRFEFRPHADGGAPFVTVRKRNSHVIYLHVQPSGFARLQFGMKNSPDLPTHKFSELKPGQPTTVEWVVLGTTSRVRINGELFEAELPELTPGGTFAIGVHKDREAFEVRNVGYVNLDGIPEAEARGLLGWETPDDSPAPKPTQREVAEHFLAAGATLDLTYPGKKQPRFEPDDALPEEDFDILGITYWGSDQSGHPDFNLVAHAPKLETLTYGGQLTSLSPVADLVHLNYLRIVKAGARGSESCFDESEMWHLANLHQLENLFISGFCLFTGEGYRHLANAKNLRSLGLGQKGENLTPLTEAGAAAISNLTSLESISLTGAAFDASNLDALKAVTSLPNLTGITLIDSCVLTPEMFSVMATMPKIETLIFWNADLQTQDFTLLEPCGDTLERLLFSYHSNLSDEGLRHIASALPNLKELQLGEDNTCTEAGIAALKAALPACEVKGGGKPEEESDSNEAENTLWQKAGWPERDLPFLAADGWMTAPNKLQSFGPKQESSQSQIKFKDGAVRATLRRDGDDQINLYCRSLEGGDPVRISVFETELLAQIAPGGRPDEFIELGRITFETPFRPGDVEVIELAAVGITHVVRFKGRELHFQTPEVTREGVVSFHGRNFAVKDVEYAVLDGIDDPWKALGWDAPSDTTKTGSALTNWQTLPLAAGESPATPNSDGWFQTGADFLHLNSWTPENNFVRLGDAVVRMKVRWTEKNIDSQLSMFFRAETNLAVPGGQVVFHLSKDRLDVIWRPRPQGSTESEVIHFMELDTPFKPGDESVFEVAGIGNDLCARVDGQTTHVTPPPIPTEGWILIGGWHAQFKDVEYVSLDGIDDPLKALGSDVPEESGMDSMDDKRPMEKSSELDGLVAGPPWTGPLGHAYVPVDGLANVLFSTRETRVKDFETFVEETGHDMSEPRSGDSELTWRSPGFEQAGDHPVVLVSREDANDYCRWLTEKERAAGRLLPGQVYRLPTDREWSAAMGVLDEEGDFPEDRAFPEDIYTWPVTAGPPRNAENLDWDNDDYEFTAPVGSGVANRFGLYDLMGNVRELCADPWGIRDGHGSVALFRGSDFRDPETGSRSRMGDPSAGRRRVGTPTVGFRCVLDLKTESQREIQVAMEEAVGKLQSVAAQMDRPRQEINVVVNDEMVMLDLRRWGINLTEEMSARLSGLPLTRFMAILSEGGATYPVLKSFSLEATYLAFESNENPTELLENLRGQPLTQVHLNLHPDFAMNVATIDFLEGAPLTHLYLWNFKHLEGIEPLRDLPLKTLHFIGHTPEALDLSPIQEARIREVILPRSIAFDTLVDLDDWWTTTLESVGVDGPSGTFSKAVCRFLSEASLSGDEDQVVGIKETLASRFGDRSAYAGLTSFLDSDRMDQMLNFHRRVARFIGGDSSSLDGQYLTHGGHSYLWGDADLGLDFEAAQAFAAALGGHLLTITSQSENDFVSKEMASRQTQRFYWLGLKRTGIGLEDWMWVTGEPKEFQAWRSGKTFFGKETGAVWNKPGSVSWEDVWYDSELLLVIEWDTPTPQPPGKSD